PEIGQVVSATTTLYRDKQPMSPGGRWSAALAGAFAGLVVGVALSLAVPSPFWQIVLPAGLGTIGMAIVLLSTRFAHTCSYAGSEGVARFHCYGDRDRTTGEVFLFKDATELRTSQTRHYTNGAYQHTQYAFTWTDVAGRKRFTLSGTYRSEAGTPPARDAFHFAAAAELTWTQYLWVQAQAQLRTSGTIFFGLGGRKWVRLGERYLSLQLGGEAVECDADELG